MLPPHSEREAGMRRFEGVQCTASANSPVRVGLSQGAVEGTSTRDMLADGRPHSGRWLMLLLAGSGMSALGEAHSKAGVRVSAKRAKLSAARIRPDCSP